MSEPNEYRDNYCSIRSRTAPFSRKASTTLRHGDARAGRRAALGVGTRTDGTDTRQPDPLMAHNHKFPSLSPPAAAAAAAAASQPAHYLTGLL